MSGPISLFAKRFPLIYSLATTRLKLSLVVMALVFAATVLIQYGILIGTSQDLFTTAGPIIGGDFIVFYWAALTAGGPQMAAIYEMSNFAAMLRQAYPGHGDFLLGWQYPPTMSLLIKPLAAFPYPAAFSLWVAVLGGLFFTVVRNLWRDNAATLFAIASPAVFISTVTGQTGLLTASLLVLCAVYAERRPLISGIAAGLLTVKPQLGLLIPIAYAARGCWRAFAFAAMTAALLMGASIAAFGIEPWRAFIEAVTAHSGRMGTEVFPAHKLVTPFGVATLLGASRTVGLALQAVVSAVLAAYVFIVWRRVEDRGLRLAALMTAALLATPYAFFYEAAILIPPLLMIGKNAASNGWLRGERSSLIGVWILALFMPGPDRLGLPIAFAAAAAAFAVVARRTLPATGITFTGMASAARS